MCSNLSVLSESDDGILLRIHLAPRASSERVMGVHNSALKIAVSAPPVDGAANQALIKYLAKLFKIPQSKVELIKGETSKQKVLLLKGLHLSQVEELVRDLIKRA